MGSMLSSACVLWLPLPSSISFPLLSMPSVFLIANGFLPLVLFWVHTFCIPLLSLTEVWESKGEIVCSLPLLEFSH